MPCCIISFFTTDFGSNQILLLAQKRQQDSAAKLRHDWVRDTEVGPIQQKMPNTKFKHTSNDAKTAIFKFFALLMRMMLRLFNKSDNAFKNY